MARHEKVKLDLPRLRQAARRGTIKAICLTGLPAESGSGLLYYTLATRPNRRFYCQVRPEIAEELAEIMMEAKLAYFRAHPEPGQIM